MSRIDAYLARFPGSVTVKAFAVTIAIAAGIAYPVFYRSEESRQGHDYFSSERPELVSAGQDRARKENRIQRGLVLDKTDGSIHTGDDVGSSSGAPGDKRE